MAKKGKKFKLARPKKKSPATIPSTSAPPPPWTELPRDVTANILHRIGAVQILQNARRVCTTWRKVCQDPAMWRVIDMKDPDQLHEVAYDLDIMCRHAVDLSRGQLIGINIEYFGTDELLQFIADRSSQLKHLTLACCDDISGKGLTEAVKKIPQLEELRLFFILSVLGGDIEAIGRSCPMLKSFTFNLRGYKFPHLDESNEYAVAVAETMPGLHHLRLFGNRMTNDGLQAILDSCPHLESLDLRQCFNIRLLGDLGNKCARIKDLRSPFDSTADYEWDAEIYESESFNDNYSSEYSDIYSIGDYDDYTNPFSSEYLSDQEAWFFDTLAISEFDTSYI